MLTLPEPKEICKCVYCGDEIYAGEAIYHGNKGLTHKECILPLIAEELSADHIATLCGYANAIAGEP